MVQQAHAPDQLDDDDDVDQLDDDDYVDQRSHTLHQLDEHPHELDDVACQLPARRRAINT